MFMNEWNVRESVERYREHPILSRATRFLLAHMEEVNAHSDGWAYWRLPVDAARSLMQMIQHPETATEQQFRKALTPIKSFYTRRGKEAGMTLPDINAPAIPDKPDVHEVLREFVNDVEAVGVAEVKDDWPDLIETYHRAKRALT